MSRQRDEKFFRVIAAAILQSDLDIGEIRAGATQLASNPAYARRLSHMIDVVAGSIANKEPARPPEDASNKEIENLLAWLDDNHLNKQELIRSIENYVAASHLRPNPRSSRREILEDFVQLFGLQAASQLVEMMTKSESRAVRRAERALSGVEMVTKSENGTDPYLSGLIQRRVEPE